MLYHLRCLKGFHFGLYGSRLLGSVRYNMFRSRMIKQARESMERMEVVTLLKVPVKVLCYGDVTPSQIVKNPETKPKKLVLIVPGNPGVAELYSEFGARIHEKTRLPVWIVAHGGHEDLPVPRATHYPDLYNLQGQVRQKRELIDSYLNGVSLRCIGHSIGSKMLLEVLKSDEKYSKQIEKVELMFPTIERMITSPAGVFFGFCVAYLYWPIIWAVVVFSLLPTFLKTLLLRVYIHFSDYPPKCIPGLIRLLEPRLIRKVLDLGDDEMKTVIKRDDEIIQKCSKILHFYYGATDNWTPLNYYEELKKDIPDVNAQVDTDGYPHTFSMKYGSKVADMIAEWWEKELFL